MVNACVATTSRPDKSGAYVNLGPRGTHQCERRRQRWATAMVCPSTARVGPQSYAWARTYCTVLTLFVVRVFGGSGLTRSPGLHARATARPVRVSSSPCVRFEGNG